MNRHIIIALVLLLLVACEAIPPTNTQAPETPQPGTSATATLPAQAQSTPTQEVLPTKEPNCPGYDTSLELLTDNFCLDGEYEIIFSNNVHQIVPSGFELYSVAQNANGYPDDFSAHAPITCEAWGCTIDVHNGVNGRDGIWGYSQTVEYTGCTLVKLTGYAEINDPAHPGDYTFKVLIDGEFRSSQLVPTQGFFELIYPMMLDGNATRVTMAIQVAWSVPGEGSEIILYGAGIYAVDESYCE